MLSDGHQEGLLDAGAGVWVIDPMLIRCEGGASIVTILIGMADARDARPGRDKWGFV
jgi:hypothetical protein